MLFSYNEYLLNTESLHKQPDNYQLIHYLLAMMDNNGLSKLKVYGYLQVVRYFSLRIQLEQ